MRIVPSIFLIFDISGYTPFVRLHKLNLLHAEKIIKDLLDIIVNTARPPLKVHEIEGDAVCFYAEQGRDPAVTARKVMEQAVAIMAAFAVKAYQLDVLNICVCDACSVVRDLKLKGFLHAGDASLKTIAGFRKEQLGGEDIILVHRLMKNEIPSSQYLVMTQAFAGMTEARPSWRHENRTETLGGFGDMSLEVYYFQEEQAEAAVASAGMFEHGIAAKLARIGELLSFSLRRVFRAQRIAKDPDLVS